MLLKVARVARFRELLANIPYKPEPGGVPLTLLSDWLTTPAEFVCTSASNWARLVMSPATPGVERVDHWLAGGNASKVCVGRPPMLTESCARARSGVSRLADSTTLRTRENFTNCFMRTQDWVIGVRRQSSLPPLIGQPNLSIGRIPAAIRAGSFLELRTTKRPGLSPRSLLNRRTMTTA